MPSSTPSSLARALGWATVGLGVGPLLAPRALVRAVGADDRPENRTLARAVGIRELIVAGGLLGRDSAGWLWARVAQDAMDVTVIGKALVGKTGSQAQRLRLTGAALLGLTAVDVVAAARATRARSSSREEARMYSRAAVTILRKPEEVYAAWRDLERLPTFMTHLEAVQVLDGTRSHWKAKAPTGSVEWDARITEDRPNELIAWESDEGADIKNSGRVEFHEAPGGRGTEVRVETAYDLPGGKLGEVVAKLFGEEPEQQIKDDLRRFKQILETGEVLRSDGTPGGTDAKAQLAQREAQPLDND